MNPIFYDPMHLANEGARLPAIKQWLLDVVWSSTRYQKMEPEDYLRSGEEAVCKLEEMISTGALSVWDELIADAQRSPSIASWLGLDAALPLDAPRAVVVFDGLSLREWPLLVRMAELTGFRIVSSSAITTSFPTETMDFVEQRVVGSRVAPSKLKGRRELLEKNTEAFYLEQPNAREGFPSGRNLLVWSSYPDRLFFNDEARSEQLFSTFHRDHIPVIWKSTVQAIPPDVPIVVTADHGYIFFGSSLESVRTSEAPALLDQSRSQTIPSNEPMPPAHPDLQLLADRRVAMLRGRLRTKNPGPSSRKLYQHGGCSLMEALVPWMVLERA